MLLFFTVAALLAACGSAAPAPADLDPTAVILTRLPTLQAQMTQNAPALQTVQSQQLTHNAPTVQANMTLLALGGADPGAAATSLPPGITPGGATGGAAGGVTGDSSSGASGGIVTEGTTESGFPVYGEGYPTTRIERITLGQSITGAITSVEAHNFLLDAASGQTITIRVVGGGGGDPRLKLIDPDGVLIADDDDGGGGVNAALTVTLSKSGTYTIRIDDWYGGAYTLTVE